MLVKLLETMGAGAEFAVSNWPLHVTLVSNFTVDWYGNSVLEKLQALLADQKTMELSAGDDEHFGPQKDVQVTVPHKSNDLLSFHKKLVALLKDVGAPRYLEDGYRAHAIVQKNRLEKGGYVLIDELSVIDMFPHKDMNRRKVLKTIKLQ